MANPTIAIAHRELAALRRDSEDLEAQGASATLHNSRPLQERYLENKSDLGYVLRKRKSQLTSGLFWLKEFGPSSSTGGFLHREDETFEECLARLQPYLRGSVTAPAATLKVLCDLAVNLNVDLHANNRDLNSALGTSPLSSHIFSWHEQLFATTRRHLKKVEVLPRYAVAAKVEDAWDGLSTCAYKSIDHSMLLSLIEHLSLPEFRDQFLSHREESCPCKTFDVANITNPYDRRPTHFASLSPIVEKRQKGDPIDDREFSVELKSPIGPAEFDDEKYTRDIKYSRAYKAQVTQCQRIFDRGTASFSFTWQREAPAYNGGFETFLWELYSQPPTCDFAEIFYQDDTNSKTDSRRVFMTSSTTSLEVQGLSLVADLGNDVEKSWRFIQGQRRGAFGDEIVLLPIFAVLDRILEDTVSFFQKASDEVMKIRFAGRSGASIQKIQYLFHLQDCRESAAYSITHALLVVEALLFVTRNSTPDQDAGVINVEFLENKEGDFKRLIDLLVCLGKRIEGQIEAIRFHRELSQGRQLSTLTYIASVWAPIAFVTGMLGMNVNDPSSIFQRSSPRNPTATSDGIVARQVNPTPTSTEPDATIIALLQNQLLVESSIAGNSSTVASYASPSPYLWGFGFFVGLAGFLFIGSILLPLVGPNLLRITVQRSYKVREWMVFWPFVFVLYYITIYWVLPEILMASLRCGSRDEACARLAEKYFFLYDFQSSSGASNASTVSYIISAVVMGTIGLTNIAICIMYRRGALMTLTWLGFAAVVITTYMLDYFSDIEWWFPYPIATGVSLSALAPLVYLLGIWSGPLVARFWRKRKQRKDKAE